MKKSRIFIGAAALLLAAAGAFAAVKNHATQTVYYISNDGTECLQTTIEFTCSTQLIHNCTKFVDGSTKLLWDSPVASPEHPCSVELQREQ